MRLHPMISALRRHKSGVVLIGLQIALTLAIVCNAVFIIGQRIERVNRPTGMQEHNLFLVNQQWVGAPSGDTPDGVVKLDNLQLADLVVLRALPDVASVTPINSLPLTGSSWNGMLSPEPKASFESKGNARTTYYFGDDHMLATLGVKLVVQRRRRAPSGGSQQGRDPVGDHHAAPGRQAFPQRLRIGQSGLSQR
jgi:putative ABC transport system permease protein